MIDLTSEKAEPAGAADQDNLSKALAASLSEAASQPGILGGQVTREEQEISR